MMKLSHMVMMKMISLRVVLIVLTNMVMSEKHDRTSPRGATPIFPVNICFLTFAKFYNDLLPSWFERTLKRKRFFCKLFKNCDKLQIYLLANPYS